VTSATGGIDAAELVLPLHSAVLGEPVSERGAVAFKEPGGSAVGVLGDGDQDVLVGVGEDSADQDVDGLGCESSPPHGR
jgi:hypothetical protein